MSKRVKIRKYSGELEVFDIGKLINSLRRSKADEELVQEIASAIGNTVTNGMTTKEIYKNAYNMLKRKTQVSAARYKLKKALMELGPSGFPFERFIAKILENEGYLTQTDSVVEGNCVSHEVDVIALKDDRHYMIECKFHSDQGRFCDVKVPLYIRSRFIDVEQQWKKLPGHHTKFHQGWLFTNTRFTSDAISYGSCVGLMMVSWDYPEKGSLKLRIDRAGLHPLTSLPSITAKEKSKLLNEGIVLCRQVADNPDLLTKVGVDARKHKRIIEDSIQLCSENQK